MVRVQKTSNSFMHVVFKRQPHLFYLFEFEQNVRNKAVLYIQNNNQELKRREIFHSSF